MIALLGWLLVVVGIGAGGWGVWAAFTREKPVVWVGAVLAPLGIIAALTGALLLFVPGFFSG